MQSYITTEKQFRPFTILYHDLWRCPELSRTERDVYISLLLYANSKTMICFPSYETIANDSKISRRTVINTIKDLIENGWIRKEQRYNADKKEYTSNIYILVDKLDKEKEEPNKEEKLQQLLDLAEELDYTVSKKEDGNAPDPDEKKHQAEENTGSLVTVDDVKQACEYEKMVSEAPELKDAIDSTMQLVTDTLNTPDEKPGVKEVFSELTRKEILYSINQLRKAKKVKNPTGYLKGILLRAREQIGLEGLPPREKSAHNKNRFNDFEQRKYSADFLAKLEKAKRGQKK